MGNVRTVLWAVTIFIYGFLTFKTVDFLSISSQKLYYIFGILAFLLSFSLFLNINFNPLPSYVAKTFVS